VKTRENESQNSSVCV